ncbi:amidase signature enzyme [Sistotremastrum niveocremeum HHB9708]|uniref:Amidase signature enzyme n=1 Tax=Sistotremastrum niveocremeum HHB9708 TaxID=1314777 RepID=A0A165AB55_9AGAM|nr:amidase signature enzyme [Sistotremastrum niveocremeum HHB9708]
MPDGLASAVGASVSFDVPSDTFPDLYEASIEELNRGLSQGHFTSVDLVKAYLARIDEVNDELHAVIETNSHALALAAELDSARAAGQSKGILHGIPIIVKDNISTLGEGMQTTAGSHALAGSVVPRDAHVVSLLRNAGAIILAKANLSEWSYFRGGKGKIASGWSGRGGQCTNPYLKNADPSGSSSGSAVCAAVGLAAATLGTETDGSIISPSRLQNLVGIKPTVGLTSRSGVVPISEYQDTVGPMCRSVADAAIILSVIAGKDARDPFTDEQPDALPDYTAALGHPTLEGVRIGVPREAISSEDWVKDYPGIIPAFEEALEVLKGLKATVVESAEFKEIGELKEWKVELQALTVEFKHCLNNYLKDLVEVPTAVRSLGDIIAFNDAHPELEKPPGYEDQQMLEDGDKANGYDDEQYQEARKRRHELGSTLGIDHALEQNQLDVLVFPYKGVASSAAATAGYPVITVPLGFTPNDTPLGEAKPTIEMGPGLPFGLCLTGTAFCEPTLIKVAHTFEQKTKHRLRRRAYEAATPRTQIKDVL